MSNEFVDMIRQVRLGPTKLFALPNKTVSVRIEEEIEPEPLRRGANYRIEAVVGATIRMPYPDYNGHGARQVQRQLTELVYGDVRQVVKSMFVDLYEFRNSRNTEDWDRVKRLEEKLESILTMTVPE